MPATGILVVDDDETIRKALVSLFADEGYESAEAGDGREALLVLLSAERPMVVLLDIKMPTLTGDQVLRFVLHDSDLR
jgi:CheY-like chemotaxis protein